MKIIIISGISLIFVYFVSMAVYYLGKAIVKTIQKFSDLIDQNKF